MTFNGEGKNLLKKMKSSVMKADSEDNDINDHAIGRKMPLIDGLYGANGFYFQQRRGRLDLRVISNLDLEKVVRDVDIDVLQMHLENVTFCNLREEDLRFITDQHVVKLFRISQLIIEYLLYVQEQLASNLNTIASKYTEKKRTLMRKRKELAELTETSKALRSQLKAKKKSVVALEDILKETGRTRGRESRRHIREERDNIPVQQQQQQQQREEQLQPPTREVYSTLKFYVTGPDGLSIEFNNSFQMTIKELKREIKQVFQSRNTRDSYRQNRSENIKLIYQGHVLLDDASLETCHIRREDTLVAIFERAVEMEDEGTKKKAVGSEPNDKDLQLELLMKQQDMMKTLASEMRQGWEASVHSLTQQQQQQQQQSQKPSRASPDLSTLHSEILLQKMEERWMKMEGNVRQQLDSQLEHYQRLVLQQQQMTSGQGRKYYVGELESDGEDKEEIGRKLKQSSTKIKSLEEEVYRSSSLVTELQEALRRQHKDMDDLRTLIHQQSKAATVTSTTTTITNQASHHSTTKKNILFQMEEEDGQQVTNKKVISGVSRNIALPAQQPVVRKSVDPAPAPSALQVDVGEEVVESDSDMVEVVFPEQYNKELKLRRTGNVTIYIPRTAEADDIIFEIRSFISDVINVPLSKVTLNISGQTVSLGLDAPGGFGAAAARDMAADGRLTAAIMEGQPITDLQLDILVEQWEKSKSIDSTLNMTEDQKQALAVKSRNSIPRFQQTVRASGERFPTSHSPPSPISKMKRHLEKELLLLSDSEGLSDLEISAKMKSLQHESRDLADDISSSLRMSQAKLTGAMASAISNDLSDSDSNHPSGTRGNSQSNNNKGSMKLLQLNKSDVERNSFATSLNRSKVIGKKKMSIEEDDVTAMGSLEISRGVNKAKNIFKGNRTPDLPLPTASTTNSTMEPPDSEVLQYSAEPSASKGSGRYSALSSSMMSSSMVSLPQAGVSVDFDRTVDTDISMPSRTDNLSLDVKRRANMYEQSAVTSISRDSLSSKPPQSPGSMSPGGWYNKNSYGGAIGSPALTPSSPFDGMQYHQGMGDGEGEGDSLALSMGSYDTLASEDRRK